MNRRSFLHAALAVATLPGWLSTAFAADRAPSTLAKLTEAWRSASEAARPLLVILIPADEEKSFRGEVLGAWINFGDEQLMATLGLCEVICATAEDLRRLVPSVAVDGQTWMVLVQTAQVPAHAENIDLPISMAHPLPPGAPKELAAPKSDERFDEPYDVMEKRVNALSELQCALVTGAFNAALPPELTAIFREHGKRAALAEEATKHLRSAPPSGVHWADAGGCGTYVEDVKESNPMMCGMGYTATRTRRFLYFYPASVLPP